MTTPRPLPRTTATVAVALGATVLLASCTSDGEPARSSGPASTPTSAATSSAPTPTPTTSDGPAGFGGVDGALLVLGASRDRADVYRVSGGKIVRVTKSAGVTGVTSAGGRTAVGVVAKGDRETVRELRGTRLKNLDADGFDPAVSADGTLVRVRLESGSSTPGISKPGGFALVVRSSLTGRDRVVFTQKQSMGSPRWVDADHVAVAVAGDRTRVLLVDVRNGKRTDLGTVEGADDLDLTSSSKHVAVATDSGGVVVDVGDRNQHAFPKGWTPLCWPTGTSVLASRSGRLATVTVNRDGSTQAPKVLGPLPAGTSAFVANCG